MSQTCMCWGCSVGNGWFNILWEMCEKIDEIRKRDNLDVSFSQIKEKFGGLRVYEFGGNNDVEKCIEEAEGKSLKTCENCGKPGNLKGDCWVQTLCDECSKAEKYED